MCGILIGTACLIGLIITLKRGRCGGRYGGGGCSRSSCHGRGSWGGHHHHDGDHGGSGWGPSFFLRMILERLKATPEQESVIRRAVDELREAAKGTKDEFKKSRVDVAKAVRGEHVDEVLFGELFSRHDTAIETLRKEAIGAIAKIHAVLDEQQRVRLAEMIEEGPGFFRRGWR